MTFQIVRIAPLHHAFTDALIGSKAYRLPNAYETERCAQAIAGRLTDAEYKAFGDDHFVVVPYGECPFTRRRYAASPAIGLDDCPF